MRHITRQQSGFSLPLVLGFIVAFSLVFIAVGTVITTNLSLLSSNIASQRAFNIAEAGINYYLWHLSHNPGDVKDGYTGPMTPDPVRGYGPFTRTFLDANRKETGKFTLWIKPASNDSTRVTVRSTGEANGSTRQRTIEADLGAPSFARYAVVADKPLWFGKDEAASGAIHSNVGVKMDGPSDSDVTASRETYTPGTDWGGTSSTSVHPGVWCNTSIATCNTRDKSGWRPLAAAGTPPVPQIDFNQVSGKLCDMKRIAAPSVANCAFEMPSVTGSDNGTYGLVPNTSYLAQIKKYAKSCNKCAYSYVVDDAPTVGYLVEFTGPQKINIYTVANESDMPTTSSYTYTNALTRTLVNQNVDFPLSGVLFAEGNVWVAAKPGVKIDGRLTIAAARLGSTVDARIVMASPLEYAQRDGSDVLGLVSEGDVQLAPYAPPNDGEITFKLNASILTQSGKVGYRYIYESSAKTGYTSKGWSRPNQTLEFYGSVGTRGELTWNWFTGTGCTPYTYKPVSGMNSYNAPVCTSSGGNYVSGFQRNTMTYDQNLRYSPPPQFPITSSVDILSWREVVTQP